MNAVKLFFVSFARVLILTRPSRDESLEFRLTGGHQRGFSIFIESVNKVNTYPPQFFQLTGGHQRGFSIFLESVNKASTYPPQLLRLTGGHQRGFSIFIESVNKVNTYPTQKLNFWISLLFLSYTHLNFEDRLTNTSLYAPMFVLLFIWIRILQIYSNPDGSGSATTLVYILQMFYLVDLHCIFSDILGFHCSQKRSEERGPNTGGKNVIIIKST